MYEEEPDLKTTTSLSPGEIAELQGKFPDLTIEKAEEMVKA